MGRVENQHVQFFLGRLGGGKNTLFSSKQEKKLNLQFRRSYGIFPIIIRIRIIPGVLRVFPDIVCQEIVHGVFLDQIFRSPGSLTNSGAKVREI